MLTNYQEPTFRKIALAVSSLIIIVNLFTYKALYADGAHFLLTLLINEGFYYIENARFFAQVIPEIPVVLAIKCGVNNIKILTLLYTIGVNIPGMIWLYVLFKSLKDNLFCRTLKSLF